MVDDSKKRNTGWSIISETDLKGIITPKNLTLIIWVNLKESSKFDENYDKRFFG